ncbi:MAG: hypothetical protein RMJ44_08090 [Cytophagales bacterium]|nr:hypothetical protein [Bernardetiaceae bacterium]MDW8211033.1 hypothetical protein [Cytophagales bacterium]
MTTQLTSVSNILQLVFPSGARLTLSSDGKKLLTEGYTSIAGNTYFNAISLTDDFVVKENVGVGWLHTFLNGLQIYTHDGKLVAERDFQCFIYSEERVLKEVTDMLTEAIVKAAQRQGIPLNQTQVRNEVFHRVRKVKRLR